MNSFLNKRIFSLVFVGLFVFLIGQQEILGQQKKELSLNDILSKLTFTSSISKKKSEINEQLTADIIERKVNFILSLEDEQSVKKAGGSELLIKTIRENLPKKIEEEILLYKKFIDNYGGSIEQKKVAIEAASELIKKFSSDEEAKELVDYYRKIIPVLEEMTKEPIPCHIPSRRNENFYKFNESFKTKKWDDFFGAGEEILKNEPDFVDVTLALASVGFDYLINKSKHDYLNQTLDYAEKSINLLEANKSSSTQLYGVFDYSYKTKEFPDGKANALGYMNYIVGYIKYFQLNQKDEAIPYFQKSLTYKSKSNELIRRLNLPEIKR